MKLDDKSARLVSRLRNALALVVVLGGLLAAATWYKHSTCGCSGGVPYTTIGLWAGAFATGALVVYVGLGVLAKRH
jgi:hypothetical protein